MDVIAFLTTCPSLGISRLDMKPPQLELSLKIISIPNGLAGKAKGSSDLPAGPDIWLASTLPLLRGHGILKVRVAR